MSTSLCQTSVFAGVLPALDVVAVSQASSPGSSPDFPLPVITTVCR